MEIKYVTNPIAGIFDTWKAMVLRVSLSSFSYT